MCLSVVKSEEVRFAHTLDIGFEQLKQQLKEIVGQLLWGDYTEPSVPRQI